MNDFDLDFISLYVCVRHLLIVVNSIIIEAKRIIYYHFQCVLFQLLRTIDAMHFAISIYFLYSSVIFPILSLLFLALIQ